MHRPDVTRHFKEAGLNTTTASKDVQLHANKAEEADKAAAAGADEADGTDTVMQDASDDVGFALLPASLHYGGMIITFDPHRVIMKYYRVIIKYETIYWGETVENLRDRFSFWQRGRILEHRTQGQQHGVCKEGVC
jgi:hypothetical protein